MTTEPLTLEERAKVASEAYYSKTQTDPRLTSIVLAALETAVAQERAALREDFEAAITGLRDAHHSGDIEQWEFAVGEAVATLAALGKQENAK